MKVKANDKSVIDAGLIAYLCSQASTPVSSIKREYKLSLDTQAVVTFHRQSVLDVPAFARQDAGEYRINRNFKLSEPDFERFITKIQADEEPNDALKALFGREDQDCFLK